MAEGQIKSNGSVEPVAPGLEVEGGQGAMWDPEVEKRTAIGEVLAKPENLEFIVKSFQNEMSRIRTQDNSGGEAIGMDPTYVELLRVQSEIAEIAPDVAERMGISDKYIHKTTEQT